MCRHKWETITKKVRGRGKPGGWVTREYWNCTRCGIQIGGVDPRTRAGRLTKEHSCDLRFVHKLMES